MMVILVTKISLAVDFLDKLIMMLILMTRIALDFLRISKRCTMMVILIKRLTITLNFLKVCRKNRMMVVILVTPTLVVGVLLSNNLFLIVSFHVHMYFQLHMC